MNTVEQLSTNQEENRKRENAQEELKRHLQEKDRVRKNLEENQEERPEDVQEELKRHLQEKDRAEENPVENQVNKLIIL